MAELAAARQAIESPECFIKVEKIEASNEPPTIHSSSASIVNAVQGL